MPTLPRNPKRTAAEEQRRSFEEESRRPDAESSEKRENERLGSTWLAHVSAAYDISVPRRVCSAEQKVPTLGRAGPAVRSYAPLVHDEIPGEIAKLRSARTDEILEFAHKWGELGHGSLCFALDRPDLWVDGDPLPWIHAHANGIHMCLRLTEALTAPRPSEMRELLKSLQGEMWGAGLDIRTMIRAPAVGEHRFKVQSWRRMMEEPEAAARGRRRMIINANLEVGIERYVSVDDSGNERSFFQCAGVMQAAYWHLANLIDGGTVKRCEAEGCGGIFIQKDPRQRYCPKQWKQRESACAIRQRVREARR